jgi:hypothetical protein
MQGVDTAGAEQADRSEQVPLRGRPGVLRRHGVPDRRLVPARSDVGATVDPHETTGAMSDTTERTLGPVVLDRPAKERKALPGEDGEDRLSLSG